MLCKFRPLFSSALIGISIIAISGCSSKVAPTAADTSVTLKGVIQLAPVKNEKVFAFKLAADGSMGSSPVAEGMSGEDGSFSLVVPEAGLYVIKTEGVGKHLDEASKVEQDAVELSAVADTNQQTEVPITPISTLHQERALELIKNDGKTPEQAMELAATEVAPKFNLDGTDLSEAPVSPYGIAALSVPERLSKARRIKVAERLATFSYFIKSFSFTGLNNDEKLGKVMAALRADFKDDGKLNGSVSGELALIALKTALTWASGMGAAKDSVLLDEAMAFDDVQSDIAVVASSVVPGEEAFNAGAALTGFLLERYYLNGRLAQLNDGAQEGLYYKDGELAHGFMESECYVNGLPMLSEGSGYCELDNKYYVSGQLAQGVISNGNYYSNGLPSGGFYDGVCYNPGPTEDLTDGTGLCSGDGKTYFSGLLANGLFNGTHYLSGMAQPVPASQDIELPGFVDGATFDHEYVWFSYRDSDAIEKRSLVDGSYISTIVSPSGGQAMQLAQAGDYIWALKGWTESGGLYRIHKQTNEVSDFSMSFPSGSTITGADGVLWLAVFNSPTIKKIDGATGDELASIDLSSYMNQHASGIAIHGSKIVVSGGEGKLIFLDKNSFSVLREVTLPESFAGPYRWTALQQGGGVYFVATNHYQQWYRYDYEIDAGAFVGPSIGSIEAVTLDDSSQGFWVADTWAYVIHWISYDGMSSHSIPVGDLYSVQVHPKIHVVTTDRVWVTDYSYKLTIIGKGTQ